MSGVLPASSGDYLSTIAQVLINLRNSIEGAIMREADEAPLFYHKYVIDNLDGSDVYYWTDPITVIGYRYFFLAAFIKYSTGGDTDEPAFRVAAQCVLNGIAGLDVAGIYNSGVAFAPFTGLANVQGMDSGLMATPGGGLQTYQDAVPPGFAFFKQDRWCCPNNSATGFALGNDGQFTSVALSFFTCAPNIRIGVQWLDTTGVGANSDRYVDFHLWGMR